MQLSKIEATLEEGRFLSGKLLVLIKIFTGLELFAGIFSLFTLVTYTEKFDFYDVAGIGGFIVFWGCGIGLIHLLNRNKKLGIKIIEYLKDAVVVRATVVDNSTLSLSERFYNGIKIKIRFTYNNKIYIYESGNPNKVKKRMNGYDKVFRRYVNKSINVLYSPKYSQIIFFKLN